MQILCAANEIYYPGDGFNLNLSAHLKLKPNDFEKRVKYILYPETSNMLKNQYAAVLDMINDIEDIVIPQIYS